MADDCAASGSVVCALTDACNEDCDTRPGILHCIDPGQSFLPTTSAFRTREFDDTIATGSANIHQSSTSRDEY